MSEAIKEYDLPATHATDGVRVPVSPVVIVNPNSEKVSMFACWDQITPTCAQTNDPAATQYPTPITVPLGKRWMLLCASISLVTSAAAGDRYMQIDVDADGGNPSGKYVVGYAHVASVSMQYSFVPGAGYQLVPPPNGSITVGFGP